MQRQNRWKSKVVWVSLLPVLTLLGDTYNLWTVINMPKDTFSQVFMSILAILALVGFLNDPTSKTKF